MATAPRIEGEDFSTFADAGVVEKYIATAKGLRDLLRAEAPKGEKLRSPTPTVDKALNENGLLTMLLPKRLGGAGLSFSDFSRVQMEIAKGDPSVSWVLQIVNGTSWVSSLSSDAIQDTIYANGAAKVCGAYNPPGKAKKVDGGWIINGSWPYTSGSRQADWAQCGVVLEGYDGPVVPGINQVYIPFSELEIVDSWYVTGMQGTGSDTSVAKDVFIPEHMIVMMDKPFGYIEPGKRHVGAPSDRLPVVPVVRATGIAQLIGAGYAILELVEADKNKPIVTTMYSNRSDSGLFNHDIGRAAAQLDSARTLLFDVIGALDDVALTGREFPFSERARQKATCGQVIELLHSAVESLMFIAGSSAFALDKPISRFWRDVHVGMRHIQNIPGISYEVYGRERLGTPNIAPPGAY